MTSETPATAGPPPTRSSDAVVDTGMSVADAVSQLTTALATAGVTGAARDARLLVATATHLRPLDLIARPAAVISADEAGRLNDMAARRCRSEPVSRILGEREFYGRTFEITPATLDPRPDSETIIAAALELVAEAERTASTGHGQQGQLRILDIGTGSGCLIVTLLAERPDAIGLATDISPRALAVALRNAERHGVADRLRLLRRDALEDVEGTYNLIVSNPPYIPTDQIASLDKDVADFDPRLALDGGTDGLDLYRRMAGRLQAVMSGGASASGAANPPAENLGWALFEIGAGQAQAVAAILGEAGFRGAVRTWADLGGHTRCVAIESRR